MQISQVFERDGLPVSFEIFPPKGELPVEAAHALAAELSTLDPAFVSVTYSAGGSGNSERTIDVARMAKDDFDLTMMAHLTCMGATKNDVTRCLRPCTPPASKTCSPCAAIP